MLFVGRKHLRTNGSATLALTSVYLYILTYTCAGFSSRFAAALFSLPVLRSESGNCAKLNSPQGIHTSDIVICTHLKGIHVVLPYTASVTRQLTTRKVGHPMTLVQFVPQKAARSVQHHVCHFLTHRVPVVCGGRNIMKQTNKTQLF